LRKIDSILIGAFVAFLGYFGYMTYTIGHMSYTSNKYYSNRTLREAKQDYEEGLSKWKENKLEKQALIAADTNSDMLTTLFEKYEMNSELLDISNKLDQVGQEKHYGQVIQEKTYTSPSDKAVLEEYIGKRLKELPKGKMTEQQKWVLLDYLNRHPSKIEEFK